MKKTIRTFLLCLCFTAARSFAGTEYHASTQTAAADTETTFPFEFEAEYAYIGESDVERGFRKVHNMDENYFYARFLYTPRIKFGILRLGADWERFEFGVPDIGVIGRLRTPAPDSEPIPGTVFLGTPQVPKTLQSVSAVIGLDTRFSESLLFRIEAQPGFYGTDNLDGDTFDVPIVLGGTYIYSADLQFIFGVSVDYERSYPVFPGGGIRWRFAPQWVLNAALPTPRFEYEVTKSVTLFAGANVKGSTFRVDNHYGDSRYDTRLNHAVVTYSEVRTGAGVDWKITPGVNLSVEGGYLPYRELDFHRADVRYKYDTGAPYGSVALHATF